MKSRRTGTASNVAILRTSSSCIPMTSLTVRTLYETSYGFNLGASDGQLHSVIEQKRLTIYARAQDVKDLVIWLRE